MAEKKKTETEAKKEKEPRVYTIPLRNAFNVPRKTRAKKAIEEMRRYLRRHLKVDDVKISPRLNEALWVRSIEKPPRRITVKVTEEEGVFTADTTE